MRLINLGVYHCSANREGTLEGKGALYLDRVAKNRGFRKISYHIVYLTDGTRQFGRLLLEKGAHAKGYNSNSIGMVYIGGLDKDGKPKDTRTPEQRKAMKEDQALLRFIYPDIKFVGHRDLSADLNGDGVITSNEYMKQCPCFSVKTEL